MCETAPSLHCLLTVIGEDGNRNLTEKIPDKPSRVLEAKPSPKRSHETPRRNASRPRTFFDAETVIQQPTPTLLALAEGAQANTNPLTPDTAEKQKPDEFAQGTLDPEMSLLLTQVRVVPSVAAASTSVAAASTSVAAASTSVAAASTSVAAASMRTELVPLKDLQQPVVKPDQFRSPFEETTVRNPPDQVGVAHDADDDDFLQLLTDRLSAAQGAHNPADENTELQPVDPPAGPYCPTAAPSLAAYQLTRRVADGGMGIVYEAFHRETRKRVAIKHMREMPSSQAKLAKRFLGEAIAASRIDHPGVADIFDFGYDTNGIPYLVMEFLEGENLGDRICRGPIGPSEFLSIACQIANVLDAAHHWGIVHRDLKPDNIFLVGSGSELRVVVLDFGVAKFLHADQHLLATTQSGQVLGTPYYMSPEQCIAGDIDSRSDVYSLGCVFYQMLTGDVPFSGSIYDVILGHRQLEPHPISKYRHVSSELEQLVAHMMAKSAHERPQSMKAIESEIAAMIKNHAHGAKNLGPQLLQTMAEGSAGSVISSGTINRNRTQMLDDSSADREILPQFPVSLGPVSSRGLVPRHPSPFPRLVGKRGWRKWWPVLAITSAAAVTTLFMLLAVS